MVEMTTYRLKCVHVGFVEKEIDGSHQVAGEDKIALTA